MTKDEKQMLNREIIRQIKEKLEEIKRLIREMKE